MVSKVADSAGKEQSKRYPELSQRLEHDLVRMFRLLADKTRLRIVLYLDREKELHVSALCERLGLPQPAVSHHLAQLRMVGMIEARRDGKHNFYSINKPHLVDIMEELCLWIDDPDINPPRTECPNCWMNKLMKLRNE